MLLVNDLGVGASPRRGHFLGLVWKLPPRVLIAMMNCAVAMRYARALLEVSQQQAKPERIEQELEAFHELLGQHATLKAVLVNPAVPPARKRGLVADLLTHAEGVSDVTNRLLTLLAERNRLVLLGEILEAYRSRLMDLRGVVHARLTTAEPLAPKRAEEIRQRLSSAMGKEVTIERSVDAAVIGGLVTQIGSTVYDGSVARHLERLKQRFLSVT